MKLCIDKKYADKQVFSNFSLDIQEGEILCILGESGSGKTTLLNILAGLTEYKGCIENMPQKVGYIFQEPRLIPSLTVQDNLEYIGARKEEISKIVEKVELSHLSARYPEQLSGGERQRVAIARAFLSKADILLLDEPFSSLDTALKIRLANVFAALWREKRQTAVFVTHDVEEACMLAHRVIVLKKGEIVADMKMQGEIPRRYGQESVEREKLLEKVWNI